MLWYHMLHWIGVELRATCKAIVTPWHLCAQVSICKSNPIIHYKHQIFMYIYIHTQYVRKKSTFSKYSTMDRILPSCFLPANRNPIFVRWWTHGAPKFPTSRFHVLTMLKETVKLWTCLDRWCRWRVINDRWFDPVGVSAILMAGMHSISTFGSVRFFLVGTRVCTHVNWIDTFYDEVDQQSDTPVTIKICNWDYCDNAWMFDERELANTLLVTCMNTVYKIHILYPPWN